MEGPIQGKRKREHEATNAVGPTECEAKWKKREKHAHMQKMKNWDCKNYYEFEANAHE